MLLLILGSCKQKNTDSGQNSNAFMHVFHGTSLLLDANKNDEGIHYLDSAFQQLPHPTIGDKFSYFAFHNAHFQKFKHNPGKALLYADSMLMMANKINDKTSYAAHFAEANYAKGDSYFDLNQYNEAFQYYFQGYLTGKNYLNNEALSDYTYRMGMIMYKKAHYKAAINYFKESYRQKNLPPANNNFTAFCRKQELLDNIGLSYKHNNNDDSALVYFNKTLRFIDEGIHRFPNRKNYMLMALGVVYGNKADVYIQDGVYDKAIGLLKKSIEINLQKHFDNADAEYSEIKLGEIYAAQHKSALLLNLLNELRLQLDTVKNSTAEADWNQLMSTYYLQEHDLQNAINYLKKYNLLKDSISKQDNLLIESDVNEQLANYEKAHQIEQLSNDNKVQLISLYVSVAFALMTFLIIFLIYRNWRVSKQDILTVNLLNKQINEQNIVLEKALNELKTSSQEKDRIMRAVAHDLRNPIGGIASLTTLMANDEYTEEQKEFINLIKEASNNSLELINEILEASNVSFVELNQEQVEINSLVSHSVELLHFKAAEKDQKIFFEPLNYPQYLYISREKIWRVVSNLITNAIKFSPAGSSIFVKVEKKAGEVIVSVKDHGIGIPDELKGEIFNMFTSAQRPGTAGEKSFGLGLSICKQIMEKSHGKIWFESDGKKSTVFYISFPLADADIQPA